MVLIQVNEHDQLDQGHIIDGLHHPLCADLRLSVVLNPTCLFKNDKVDSIVVAYLIPFEFVLSKNKNWISFLGELDSKMRDGTEVLSKNKHEKVEKIIGVLIDSDEPRRHFFLGSLPSCDIPNVFVDFQQIASFPLEIVKPKIKIIAKISRPFREKMITNYAGYMMRIGTDRYKAEERQKIVNCMAAPLKLPT